MDVGLAVRHIAVGLLFAGHGAQKLFGLFGGHGLGSCHMPQSYGRTPTVRVRCGRTRERSAGARAGLAPF